MVQEFKEEERVVFRFFCNFKSGPGSDIFA